MNNKRKIFWIIFLVIGIVILAYAVDTVFKNSTRLILEENFLGSIKQYENGDIEEINFSTLSPFTWNKLYIFGPYTSCRTVSKYLKKPLFWFNCQFLGANPSEHKSLLVFVNHGYIRQYLVIDMDISDSMYPLRKGGYSFDEARFKLNEIGQLVWMNDN